LAVHQPVDIPGSLGQEAGGGVNRPVGGDMVMAFIAAARLSLSRRPRAGGTLQVDDAVGIRAARQQDIGVPCDDENIDSPIP